MTTLTHSRQQFQPVVVNITVTIRLDAIFWLAYALAWLVWLPLAGLGRWLRGCAEWWAAAGYGVRQAPGMMLEDWTRFWFKAGWSYA